MTLDDLKAAFALADDWEERYAIIIDLGRKLAGLSAQEQVEANIVKGCMSQVWMVAEVDAQGQFQVRADSDALIVRGLIGVLLLIVADKTAAEVARLDMAAEMDALDLARHVSVNRRNGLSAMVLRIRQLAAEAAASGE